MSRKQERDSSGGRQRLPLHRRLLSWFLLAAGLLLLLEIGSFCAFWLIYHSGFSWSALAEARQARIAAGKTDADSANLALSSHLAEERDLVLHPYLGYTKKPGESVWAGSPRKIHPKDPPVGLG